MVRARNAARHLAGNLTAARANRRTEGISILIRRQVRSVAGSNCTVGSSNIRPMPMTRVSAISIFVLSDILHLF